MERSGRYERKTHARSIRRIYRRKLYTAGRRAEYAALLLFFGRKIVRHEENGLTPGCKTSLIVYRAGEYREVPVVLGELPDEDGEEDCGWCDFDNAW